MIYGLLFLLLSLFGGSALAADTTQTARVVIDEWLVAGPYSVSLPVFSDTAHVSDDALLAADIVPMRDLLPREGDDFNLRPGKTLQWSGQKMREFNGPDNPVRPGAVCLASYITFDHSESAALQISAGKDAAFAAYLDGKELDDKPHAEGETLTLKSQQVFHRGKHVLIIKSVCGASGVAWTVKASVTPGKSSVSITTDPRRVPANFSDITLFDNLSSPTLSPDGKWLAIVHSHRNKDLKKEAWLEIWDARASKLVHTLRPLKGPDNPFFFSKSEKFGFTTTEDSGSTLWVMNMQSGELTPAIKGIAGLAKLVCSPDGQFVYYTADSDKRINEEEPSVWTALENRMSDWTDTRKLYVASLKDGTTDEITATGGFAMDEFALSREGDKLLFTRRVPHVGRPYYGTEFWTYDIAQGKAVLTLAAQIPWERRPQNLTWLPGGEKLVYSACRYTVEPGDTTKRDLIDGTLWLLDIRTGKAVNLSANENFSLAEDEGRNGILWNEKEKAIDILVRAGGRVVLVRYDPFAAAPKFAEVPFKSSFIADFDLSRDGTCAFIASDPVTPAALYMSGGKGTARLVSNPAKDILPTPKLATVEKWNFTDSLGYSIDGWLYYPPDFSSQKKYPLVVYYYGGTYPRDERFSFTYHWWAANGYVVYVLNPAGAVAYGEKFATLHANDWGTLATRDIIEGTHKLVAAKPFIDSTKMAAYGGSYGGFITMDLATKTTMFAALVSDAGISDIASYFGGGTWGFSYGDIALPNSYPWSRSDIFAGKSPLYHADKIHTPLLLIHGLADDNVPPVESAEMFTALKVLGRDVAFARFPNEDHSIAIKFSDLVTYREMMLAWFDKYLNGQTDAWDDVVKRMGTAK